MIALTDLGVVSFATGVYINRDSASAYTWSEFSNIVDDWDDAKDRYDW